MEDHNKIFKVKPYKDSEDRIVYEVLDSEKNSELSGYRRKQILEKMQKQSMWNEGQKIVKQLMDEAVREELRGNQKESEDLIRRAKRFSDLYKIDK